MFGFSGFSNLKIKESMSTYYVYYCIIGCGTGWVPLFYIDASSEDEAFKEAMEIRTLERDEMYCLEKEPMKHHSKVLWKDGKDYKNLKDKKSVWTATILGK